MFVVTCSTTSAAMHMPYHQMPRHTSLPPVKGTEQEACAGRQSSVLKVRKVRGKRGRYKVVAGRQGRGR